MRALRVLLLSLLALLGALAGLVVLIWFYPQLILNEKTLRWANTKQSLVLFDPGLPDDLSFSVRNEKVVRQRVELSLGAVCVELTDGSLKACFEKIALSAVFGLKDFHPYLHSAGPIDIVASSVFVRTDAKKAEAAPAAEPAGGGLPLSLAEDFELKPLRIEARSIELRSGKSSQKGALALSVARPENDPRYAVDLKAELDSSIDPKKIRVGLQGWIDEKYDLALKLDGKAATPGKRPALALGLEGTGNLRTLAGHLRGRMTANYFFPSIPLLEIRELDLKNGPDGLDLRGKVDTNFAVGEYAPQAGASALPAPPIRTKLSGLVTAKRVPGDEIRFGLELNPSVQYGLSLGGKVSGFFNPDTSVWGLSETGIRLESAVFARTVAALEKTRYAVPAPFNELRGSASLVIGEGAIASSREKTFRIPVRLETRLKSPTQALVTETSGDFAVTPQPLAMKMTLQAKLNEIWLQAPDLNPIVPMPAVVGDSRIVEKGANPEPSPSMSVASAPNGKPAMEEPSVFAYDVAISTPAHPIRVLHRIFEPAAAFRVNGKVSNMAGAAFDVKFEPMKVVYLKREATLEKLLVNVDPEKAGVGLDGRVSIQKADYTLFADLGQVGGKTSIELSSDPPLSEDDIVSLILFNQLSSDLDSGGASSVQDTRSAISKRAVGFFSFWVLSSTPVESVAYDPTTHVYSARVKLPGGFTATVGSDWENAQEIGLRKRLGGKWVVTAGSVTDSKGVTTQESMIEWYNRY